VPAWSPRTKQTQMSLRRCRKRAVSMGTVYFVNNTALTRLRWSIGTVPRKDKADLEVMRGLEYGLPVPICSLLLCAALLGSGRRSAQLTRHRQVQPFNLRHAHNTGFSHPGHRVKWRIRIKTQFKPCFGSGSSILG
jgi:hypothetical protein